MIWADRIGIGLTALTAIVLTFGHFYFSNEAAQRIERHEAAQAKSMELCDQLRRDELNLLARFMCREEKTDTIEIPTAVSTESYFIKVFLYFLLPFWLALRVIDFIFGGPARRRSQLYPLNNGGPNG
jgi:hypothetical protein